MTLGVETSKNLYVFPMVGFHVYLMYIRDKNVIQVCKQDSGIVLKETELHSVYRGMTFEDFVAYAQRVYKENINIIYSN